MTRLQARDRGTFISSSGPESVSYETLSRRREKCVSRKSDVCAGTSFGRHICAMAALKRTRRTVREPRAILHRIDDFGLALSRAHYNGLLRRLIIAISDLLCGCRLFVAYVWPIWLREHISAIEIQFHREIERKRETGRRREKGRKRKRVSDPIKARGRK